MDSQKKSKGEAEKERIKKRKAVDAAKCCKISDLLASMGPGQSKTLTKTHTHTHTHTHTYLTLHG